MANFWQSIFRGLFFSKDKTHQEDGKTRENVIEPDFIDYDGIGNQGRFVEKKKKNKKRK